MLLGIFKHGKSLISSLNIVATGYLRSRSSRRRSQGRGRLLILSGGFRSMQGKAAQLMRHSRMFSEAATPGAALLLVIAKTNRA